MKTKPSVVLTGGGILSGLGVGLEPFWNALRRNESAVTVKTTWNVPDLATDEAIFYAPCAEFNLTDHVGDLRPPFPLRYSQLAMVGCRLAIDNAGLDVAGLVAEQLGLILDTTLSANAAAEAFLYKLYIDGPAKVSPFVFTKTTTNCALGDVARAFKLKGPSSILLGENSVCYGYDLIRDGKADVVICGGFDEIRETTLLANMNRGYLPSVTDAFGRQRTFTESLRDEQGIVVYGEGAAFAVLESAEHARRRQATVLTEVLDYQVSVDTAYRDFIYERSADDLSDHLTEFCQHSQIDPAGVELFVGGGGGFPGTFGPTRLLPCTSCGPGVPCPLTSTSKAGREKPSARHPLCRCWPVPYACAMIWWSDRVTIPLKRDCPSQPRRIRPTGFSPVAQRLLFIRST